MAKRVGITHDSLSQFRIFLIKEILFSYRDILEKKLELYMVGMNGHFLVHLLVRPRIIATLIKVISNLLGALNIEIQYVGICRPQTEFECCPHCYKNIYFQGHLMRPGRTRGVMTYNHKLHALIHREMC